MKSPAASLATGSGPDAGPSAPPPVSLLERVRQAYRRMAPVYDSLFGLSLEPGRRSAVAALAVEAGDRVLEVGVGTGLALPRWRRDAAVTGIDLCPEMLARARRLCARRGLTQVTLEQMNAQETRFPDDYFDRIVGMYVVSVVPDPAALMRELVRIARPGARVVIINHFAHRHAVMRRLEQLLAALTRLLGWDIRMPLDTVCDAPGLRILEVKPANWLGYWTLVVAEVTAKPSRDGSAAPTVE